MREAAGGRCNLAAWGGASKSSCRPPEELFDISARIFTGWPDKTRQSLRPERIAPKQMLDVGAAGALAFGSYLLVAMMLDEPGWALALALTIVAEGGRYVAFYMST